MFLFPNLELNKNQNLNILPVADTLFVTFASKFFKFSSSISEFFNCSFSLTEALMLYIKWKEFLR